MVCWYFSTLFFLCVVIVVHILVCRCIAANLRKSVDVALWTSQKLLRLRFSSVYFYKLILFLSTFDCKQYFFFKKRKKKTLWEKRFHVRHLSEIYFTAVDVGGGRGFSAGIPHIIAVFLKSTRMRHSWRASDPVQSGMNRLPQVVTGSQIQEEKMITK